MYSDAKSCIVHNNKMSDMFACEIGVRQVANLSLLLFSIYLNDLQDFLEELNIKGIDSISRDIENVLMKYFKILILLYADDTILLSESKDDLQIMLNEFSTYFLTTSKYLQEKVTQAMYGLLQQCRKHKLSIECQFDMFDKTILPILFYRSEICGFENIYIIERVHLRLCKLILHLKQSTPNVMVYGELGR